MCMQAQCHGLYWDQKATLRIPVFSPWNSSDWSWSFFASAYTVEPPPQPHGTRFKFHFIYTFYISGLISQWVHIIVAMVLFDCLKLKQHFWWHPIREDVQMYFNVFRFFVYWYSYLIFSFIFHNWKLLIQKPKPKETNYNSLLFLPVALTVWNVITGYSSVWNFAKQGQ